MKKKLWKKITAISLCLVLFILAGCSKEPTDYKEPSEEKPTEEEIKVPHPLETHFARDAHYVDDVNNWDDALKSVGVTGGKVAYKTEKGNGYIITIETDSPIDGAVTAYAVYVSEGSAHIEKAFENALLEKVEVCEIDGDTENEEIALYIDYVGNGGAGVHETQIWNFQYWTASCIFTTDCDFGYSSIRYKGYEVIVDNIYTGFQTTINFKDHHHVEHLFDENGNPTEAYGLTFEGAYETIIEDVDNDGLDELTCKEYSYFDSRTDYIGSTVTVIDYNTDLKDFVVVDANFVESAGEYLV